MEKGRIPQYMDIQGIRPKTDPVSGLWRPAHKTTWGSALPDFSQVMQGQVGTANHMGLAPEKLTRGTAPIQQGGRLNNIIAKSSEI